MTVGKGLAGQFLTDYKLLNIMSHEIEADYKEDWETEATQCERCTSFFVLESGVGYCNEAKAEVPFNAHCDFFQSTD